MLGVNNVGQLGLGDTATRGDEHGEMGDALPAVQLGQGRTAIAIAAGYSSTCALLDKGLIKCWGWNNFGQLGLRDTSMRGTDPNQMGHLHASVDLGVGRVTVDVAAGGSLCCALLDNGQLKCWVGITLGSLGWETRSTAATKQTRWAMPCLRKILERAVAPSTSH